MKRLLLATTLIWTICSSRASDVTKVRDLVIYSNAVFHCAFPSIVHRPNGELLLAFRRAPDRRNWGEASWRHTDANSYLELTRSKDNGTTWTEPTLLYANPFGGSQDPCMVQLKDHSILCTSFGWTYVRSNTIRTMPDIARSDDFALAGGYILRSTDDGVTWQPPIYPPPVPEQNVKTVFGQPVPAFNRGAMCEGKDGRLYWAVLNNPRHEGAKTGVALMISADHGTTWNYSCPIAGDPKIVFNETSLYQTPKGDLVAFLRTEHYNDDVIIARSTNNGASFEHWEDAGFQGHPDYALRLPDKRVLLVYGYRHKPYGIRARVLNAECTDFRTAPEIVLRDDGGNTDLGYPWATVLNKHEVLVVYYFNHNNGPRYIAGTVLSIQ